MRVWDATHWPCPGECEKERANNGTENAAVQCYGVPPVLAASSYLSAFPPPFNKIVIQIWDLATQEPRRRLQWDDSLEIHQSVFLRDGLMVRLFQWASPRVRFAVRTSRHFLKREKEGNIRCMAISAARDRLASATYEKELEIWDVTGTRLAQQIHITDNVTCMDFSPDGRSLVYGSDRGTIEQIEIGEEKAARGLSCFGHNGVNAIMFSPNGSLLCRPAETRAARR